MSEWIVNPLILANVMVAVAAAYVIWDVIARSG